MEIKDLILLIWRNTLYIILGLALGMGIGFIASNVQTPVYEATTKVFVSRTRLQNNADILSLSDEQLLAINLQLVKSQPVLDGVSSYLGWKVDVDKVQVEALPNTLILQIKVQDNDPSKSAVIANILVQNLIQHNETLLSGQYTIFETALNEQLEEVQKQIDSFQIQINQINDASIQEQLAQVNQQIDELKAQISTLQGEIGGFSTNPTPIELASLAGKQAQMSQLNSLMALYQQIQTNLTYIGKPGQSGSDLVDPQLSILQSTLDLYQQINLTLINSRENVRLVRSQNQLNLMQIVTATAPKTPIRPLPALYVLIAGVFGLILAVSTILILDHFDNSLRTSDQIGELLGLPILGIVLENKNSKGKLVTLSDPVSKQSDAFRALGASLEVIGAPKISRTYLILNIAPGESKTNIAANLAVIHAQQGKRTILLDGDIKHPHLHNLFGMKNQNGFAEHLTRRIKITNAIQAVKGVGRMVLIPAGIIDKDTIGWLDTEKWTLMVSDLRSIADIVIVDGPSVESADSQILTSKMESVILVIKLRHSRVDSALTTLKQLQLMGANIIGVVLIQVLPKHAFGLKNFHRQKQHPVSKATDMS